MRLLEKGFGCCSLRIATLVVLLIHAMIFFFLAIVFLFNIQTDVSNRFPELNTYESNFFRRFLQFLLATAFSTVFFYSFFNVLRHNCSMLTVSIVLLWFIVFSKLVSMIEVIRVLNFWHMILFLLVGSFLAVFDIYSIWVLYSYKVQFRKPVPVNI